MNPRIKEKDGVFTIVMCWDFNEHLRWMIDRNAPWIWLPCYEDRSLHRWHQTVLPSRQRLCVEARFSAPAVDVLVPTEQFLEALPQWRLCLQQVVCQLNKRVPDTLRYENVQGARLYPVLIENGLHLHILLTYDNEALVTSPNIAVLERLLEAEPLPLRRRSR